MSDFAWREALASAAMLFLIMDPFGNAPVFNAILKDQKPRARTRIIVRECIFALVILMLFLLTGTRILTLLGLSQPSLNISGGILLFLISIHLVFPRLPGGERDEVEDPFIVPLAVPMIAGPSAIAVVLLMGSSRADMFIENTFAIFVAWLGATAILAASPVIVKRLGERGTRAMERLMGMLLVMIAVQMFLNGLSQYIRETVATTG
jgi:multiple antibiotic resistance protein